MASSCEGFDNKEMPQKGNKEKTFRIPIRSLKQITVSQWFDLFYVVCFLGVGNQLDFSCFGGGEREKGFLREWISCGA